MKVAFDHQAFTMQPYGGISRYYVELAQELFSLKQEVTIFAGIYQNNYLSHINADLVKGKKIHEYPPKTGRLFESINCYWTNRKLAQWQPDIIHETYYSIRSKPTKVPLVVTVYDMIHELYPSMFNENDPLSSNKQRALSRADHIISISHSTKKDLIELFDIEPNKISVVHLAGQTPLSDDDLLRKSNFQQRPFLLYVGGREGYKNFKHLLEAVASSEKLLKEFDIIAFGGGQFSTVELTLMQSLKFSINQVRQVSGSDNVLKNLYASAVGFVYPSLYEGFGLPPLEAMASSCPVISSNTSSMPEVIGDAAEYFNPSSIEELSAGIEKVVFSPARSKELVEKGKLRIQAFSWGKCARETLDVYKTILG